MKICRYIHKTSMGKIPRLGILLENKKRIIDPNFCWALDYEREGKFNPKERANYKMPTELSKILNLFDDPIEALEEAYGLYLFLEKIQEFHLKDGTPIYVNLADEHISLANPMDKITTYRDFYAHEKHVEVGFKKRNEKIPEAWYQIPAYYKGATAGFIGNGEEILWPKYTDILDYELELAAIIGKEGKNIKEMDANTHIFGFTILNDISARDIQKKEMSIKLGPAKGKDFCSILGPVIVTMDEFEFTEPNLNMKAFINGKKWSEGSSGDSHFNFAQMISHVSQDEWILPGDVLGSGTVGTGCGLELDKWIKEGDEITLEVEKIGKLTNKVGKRQK